ncbi:MAG: thymidylate synthase [Candidatus Limnocylindria bacterium]
MKQYLAILRKIVDEGVDRPDRTGTGTRAVFGEVMRFRMSEGFPAVTTKRLAFRAVIAELLWFICASSDVKELHKLGVHIWDGNVFADYWRPKARFEGDAGRNYGQQWRDWDAPGDRRVDQLADLVARIRSDPASRRHVVTAWDPAEIEDTSLPACHAFFQLFVADGRLSLMMYQRSADMFLGVPFNSAQYALLLHLIAQLTDLEPDELIHVLADAHVYSTHSNAVREQLSREPFPAPRLWLDPSLRSLEDVEARYRGILASVDAGEKPGPLLDGVARLVDYQHHPAIKAEMAV